MNDINRLTTFQTDLIHDIAPLSYRYAYIATEGYYCEVRGIKYYSPIYNIIVNRIKADNPDIEYLY